MWYLNLYFASNLSQYAGIDLGLHIDYRIGHFIQSLVFYTKLDFFQEIFIFIHKLLYKSLIYIK